MNISFNTKFSKLYDYIRTITLFIGSPDFIETLKNLDRNRSSFIIEEIEYIWNQLDRNTLGLSLLFLPTLNKPCFIENAYIKHLHDIETINNFIKLLFETPVKKLQVDLLTFFDTNNNDEIFYLELLTNQEKLFSFIASLDMLTKQKWELTGIINNPNQILVPLRLLCENAKKAIDKVYLNNISSLSSLKKQFQAKITKDSEHFIYSELKCISSHFFKNENRDIIVTCSLLYENGLLTTLSPSYRVIILGNNYERLVSRCENPSDVFVKEDFFKAFSDKNRLKIIKMLLEKDMYVGEIAKSCGLSISTASYHMDTIKLGGLVGRSLKHKKVYYTIDKKYLSQTLKQLLQLIEESEK